jgi:PAS domain S-box-containing protein
MRGNVPWPFVQTTSWGLAVLVLIALLVPVRAFADEPSATSGQQKQTEQDRCQFLMDKVSGIILSLNPEGNITFLNHYGRSFFGYSNDEILGKLMLGTLTPSTGFEGRDLLSFFDGLKHDPNRYAFSVNQNILRNGQKVWIFWSNTGIYDDQGQVLEVLRVGLDITDRERRVEAATAGLREISNMLAGRSWVQRKSSKRSLAGSRKSARCWNDHGR